MKRSEERALKAYQSYVEIVSDLRGTQESLHGFARACFEEGYESAEKDFLEKAIKWLLTQKNIGRVFITNFRKAMEEDE